MVIDVSGLIPEAQAIVAGAAAIYCNHTAPWFIGLVAHGSAVKGGDIPNCSDIDFQLYLTDDAFAVNGDLPLPLGMAIHRELAQIDPTPFRYIQCYALPPRLRPGWVGARRTSSDCRAQPHPLGNGGRVARIGPQRIGNLSTCKKITCAFDLTRSARVRDSPQVVASHGLAQSSA